MRGIGAKLFNSYVYTNQQIPFQKVNRHLASVTVFEMIIPVASGIP